MVFYFKHPNYRIMTHDKKESARQAEREYPGAAIDNADNNKVTKKLVDESTCAINNNPRTGERNADPATPPADN